MKQNVEYQKYTGQICEATPSSSKQADKLTPRGLDELTLEELDKPITQDSIQGKTVHLMDNGIIIINIKRSASQQPLPFCNKLLDGSNFHLKKRVSVVQLIVIRMFFSKAI